MFGDRQGGWKGAAIGGALMGVIVQIGSIFLVQFQPELMGAPRAEQFFSASFFGRIDQPVSQFEGRLHPYTPRTEGPRCFAEQRLAGGVVQIHGERVGETHHDLAQRIARTCALAQEDVARTLPVHLLW